MPSTKPRNPVELSHAVPDQEPETRLESAGQFAVTYSAELPMGPPHKEIHPRLRLPEVPNAPPRKRDQK
jgi:hypothetical protein